MGRDRLCPAHCLVFSQQTEAAFTQPPYPHLSSQHLAALLRCCAVRCSLPKARDQACSQGVSISASPPICHYTSTALTHLPAPSWASASRGVGFPHALISNVSNTRHQAPQPPARLSLGDATSVYSWKLSPLCNCATYCFCVSATAPVGK